MQPTTPKIILLAFALIAIFMPHAFTAEYNAPATLTSLGTQAWTAAEKTQALVGSSTVDFAARKIEQKTLSLLNSAANLSVVEQPFVAAIDSATILASFTFPAQSGAEIDIYFNGVKANVETVNIHKKFRVSSGAGVLTITTVASDTWGGADVLSSVTLVDIDGYSCSLTITGESPNYFSISGVVTMRGSPTSALIRSTIP